jgi:hypothetical protein
MSGYEWGVLRNVAFVPYSHMVLDLEKTAKAPAQPSVTLAFYSQHLENAEHVVTSKKLRHIYDKQTLRLFKI